MIKITGNPSEEELAIITAVVKARKKEVAKKDLKISSYWQRESNKTYYDRNLWLNNTSNWLTKSL